MAHGGCPSCHFGNVDSSCRCDAKQSVQEVVVDKTCCSFEVDGSFSGLSEQQHLDGCLGSDLIGLHCVCDFSVGSTIAVVGDVVSILAVFDEGIRLLE